MKHKDHLCVMYANENDLLHFYSNLPAMAKQRIKLYPKWNALSLHNQDYEILKNRMSVQGEAETKGLVIEKNILYKLHYSDTYTEKQVMPWGISRVEAPPVWSATEGEGVKVGIIDTGINGRHPDLRDNVKGGINTVDSSSPFVDRNGHGTHVAGTVAAVNNQIGVVGVSPKAQLYALKAFDDEGSATLTDIAQAIDWAIDNNIRILNMSFGSRQTSQVLHHAIKAAFKKGVIMIASAGNSSESLDYPARHPEVLAIGAVDKRGKVPPFSNFGSTLNYVAPGVDILSTWPQSPYYNTLSGTSMATPHVSGIVALLLSKAPQLTPSQVKRILDRSAQKLPRITTRKQGRGFVKAKRALLALNRLTKKASPS
ncbi:S8 family peptidase [Ammoniphilus sp. 3BR4]|uniref:S8 family peptidase n=1 Tax=Ammoniphilus sp. 3BR4 TaxID=3158265 RepID=UPI0034665364